MFPRSHLRLGVIFPCEEACSHDFCQPSYTTLNDGVDEVDGWSQGCDASFPTDVSVVFTDNSDF
ncbi:hypothetical protein DPMN_045826 [Dreissena polymorpha]|uniref:Uncharacterized protein n=1 Tax=Dreissena polymorpha TaxID=45954 RepID=A0A9D4HZZ4_DREPO|nr:hypothetical protein DPMN_045826 [Dreissena polymorpha]